MALRGYTPTNLVPAAIHGLNQAPGTGTCQEPFNKFAWKLEALGHPGELGASLESSSGLFNGGEELGEERIERRMWGGE